MPTYITSHMCLDIRGMMRKTKRELKGLMTHDDGRAMTADEVWDALADELAKGRRVLPFGKPCDGFSYQTGCPGHPVMNMPEPSPMKSAAQEPEKP